MNGKGKLTAFVLILALALCLLPATALAVSGGTEPPEAAEPAQETPAPAEGEEPAAQEPAEEGTALAEFHCAAGETLYAPRDSVTYNNGGLVYNNGGTVYNNGGLVYNNAGTAYNNQGTVYANGGTVYNNAGTVYDNGAVIYSHEGEAVVPADGTEPEQAETVPEDCDPVTPEADYTAFAEFEGLDTQSVSGTWLLKRGESCVIRVKEGFSLLDFRAEGGLLEEGEDGELRLTGQGEEIRLSLRFKALAPAFDLAPGSYCGEQSVSLSAAEGLPVYYTQDGSEPTEDSPLYEGPIALSQGAALKAAVIVPGAEASDTAEASYAIVEIEGPKFEPVEEGYARPAAQPVRVGNPGGVDARVQSVALSGTDARRFFLSHSTGLTVPAGKSQEVQWVVQPNAGLPAGEYRAVISVTLDSGQVIELELSFTVKEAEG